MNKIAFFVEGQTEAIFTKKLIMTIADREGLQVKMHEAHRYISFATIMPPSEDTKNYILIFDCGGDFAVKQKIKDNEDRLREENYKCIIGLRDLHPLDKNDLKLVQSELYAGLKINVPTKIIVAIMEIEAWFIQEYTHFLKIDGSLTPERIEDEMGFNPESQDTSNIDCPADFLNSVYNLIGRQYKKKEHEIHFVTDNLDYDEIYLNMRTRKPDLDDYLQEIDNAI